MLTLGIKPPMPSRPVPKGEVLVPKQPTPDMVPRTTIVIDPTGITGDDHDADFLAEPRHHAFMAQILQKRWIKEFQNVDLPVIDPVAHEGIWAIPDDGCNSTTHGERWKDDAAYKMRKKGVEPRLVATKSTSFSGVGKAQAKGQYQLPFCLKLEETGFRLASSSRRCPEAS